MVPTTTKARCDCEGCRSGDLPVNPFHALRVAYGMLLGEQDFRELMGNPRGKQMLATSWLHGSGVYWGLGVAPDGDFVRFAPGLAADGIGREVRLETSHCEDLRPFVKASRPKDATGCGPWVVKACVVIEFDSCLSDPVPTLADPCDVTRKHDDYSRVVERARIRILLGCCPQPVRPYHRVRVLLGLDAVGCPDPAGHDARDARDRVGAAAPECRTEVLLTEFRRLAALDSIDRRPAPEPFDCYESCFPVDAEDSAVLLASLEIKVRDRDGDPEIEDIEVDCTVRTALLPTATIQELACGLAPGCIGDKNSEDAKGPRLDGARVDLSDHGLRLTLPFTEALASNSVSGSVGITSLSSGKAGGWVVEDVYDTRYDELQKAIVVQLADRPINNLIRVVVKGTGPKPVMGLDPPVPLAGLVGGPPGTVHDGHDAVWTFDNPVTGRGATEAEPDVPSGIDDGPQGTKEAGR